MSATRCSPNLTRLDRILSLVTSHEAHGRAQDVEIAEVNKKLADLELRMQHQWEPLWALKERNVGKELDMARVAVETVVRQVAMVTRNHQALQADITAHGQKQQQQDDATRASVLALTAEVKRMQHDLLETQRTTHTIVEQLRTSLDLHLQAQQREVEQRLQNFEYSARREWENLRMETACGSGTAELESWTRGELLAITGKLKAVVHSCAAQHDSMLAQLQEQHVVLEQTRHVAQTLGAEHRRLRRAVAHLQHQGKKCQQQLELQCTASETAMQQLHNKMQQVQHASTNLTSRMEALAAESSDNTEHLAHLAGNAAACLKAAWTEQQTMPQSYLGGLLGPPAGAAHTEQPFASHHTGQGLNHDSRRAQQWDERMKEFDHHVLLLRSRLQGNEVQRCRFRRQTSSPTSIGQS